MMTILWRISTNRAHLLPNEVSGTVSDTLCFSVPLLVNGFQIVELLFSKTMYFIIVREDFSWVAQQGFAH